MNIMSVDSAIATLNEETSQVENVFSYNSSSPLRDMCETTSPIVYDTNHIREKYYYGQREHFTDDEAEYDVHTGRHIFDDDDEYYYESWEGQVFGERYELADMHMNMVDNQYQKETPTLYTFDNYASIRTLYGPIIADLMARNIVNVKSVKTLYQQGATTTDDEDILSTFNHIMLKSDYISECSELRLRPIIAVNRKMVNNIAQWTCVIVLDETDNIVKFHGIAPTRQAARVKAMAAAIKYLAAHGGKLRMIDLFKEKVSAVEGRNPREQTMLDIFNTFIQSGQAPAHIYNMLGIISLEIQTRNKGLVADINMIFTEGPPVRKTIYGTSKRNTRLLMVDFIFYELYTRSEVTNERLIAWFDIHKCLDKQYPELVQQGDQPPAEMAQADEMSVESEMVNDVQQPTEDAAIEVTDVEHDQEVVSPDIDVNKLLNEGEVTKLEYSTDHMLPLATLVLTPENTNTKDPILVLDVLDTILKEIDNINVQQTLFKIKQLAKPKLKVIIKVNATYVYQGRLIAEIFPQLDQLRINGSDGNIDYKASRIDVDSMINRGATEFDIAKSTDVILELNFMDVVNALDIRKPNNLKGYATLLIGAITPLRTGTDEMNQLTLNIYISPDETEFLVRTYPIFSTPTTSETATKPEKYVTSDTVVLEQQGLFGSVKRIGVGVGKAAAKTAYRAAPLPPGTRTAVRVGRKVARGIREPQVLIDEADEYMNGAFGCDRPEVITEPNWFRPTYVNDLSAGQGVDAMFSTRLNPAAEPIIPKLQTNIPLTVSEIAQKPSRIDVFQLNMQQVANQNVYSELVDYQNGKFNNTNMKYVMDMFYMVRSGVAFKFQFVKPAGTQGAVMISFTPGVTTATFQQARNAYYTLVDLHEADEHTFVCPYWGETTARAGADKALGVVQMWISTPITAPSITSRIIDCVVKVYAHDDFEACAIQQISNKKTRRVPLPRKMGTKQAELRALLTAPLPDIVKTTQLQQQSMVEYLMNETQMALAEMMSRYQYIMDFDVDATLAKPINMQMFIGSPASRRNGLISRLLYLFKYVNCGVNVFLEFIPKQTAVRTKRSPDQQPIVIPELPSVPDGVNVQSFTIAAFTPPAILPTKNLSNNYTSLSGSDGDAIRAGSVDVRHSPYNVSNTILTLDFNKNGNTCSTNNNRLEDYMREANTVSIEANTMGERLQRNIGFIKESTDSMTSLNTYTARTRNVDSVQNQSLLTMTDQLNANITAVDGTLANLQSQIDQIEGVVANSEVSAIIDITYSPPFTTSQPFQGPGTQKVNTAINPGMSLQLPKMNVYQNMPTYIGTAGTDGVKDRMTKAAELGVLNFKTSRPVTVRMYARLSDSKKAEYFLGAPVDFPNEPRLERSERALVQQGNDDDVNATVEGRPSIVEKKSFFKAFKNQVNPIHKANKVLQGGVSDITSLCEEVKPLVDKTDKILENTQNITADLSDKLPTITTNIMETSEQMRAATEGVSAMVETVRDALTSAAAKISKFYQEHVSIDSIIVAMIDIAIGIINPNPMTIIMLISKQLVTFGIICSKTLQKLMNFFMEKFKPIMGEKAEPGSETSKPGQLQQQGGCLTCGDIPNPACQLCEMMAPDKRKVFGEKDKQTLISLLIGAIGATLQWKGKCKNMNIKTKLFETTFGFWRTHTGIQNFVRNFYECIRNIIYKIRGTTSEAKALKTIGDTQDIIQLLDLVSRLSNATIRDKLLSIPKGRLQYMQAYCEARKVRNRLAVLCNPKISKTVDILTKFINDGEVHVKRIMTSSTRYRPTAFMLFGPSNTGKSRMMPLIMENMLKRAVEDKLANHIPAIFTKSDGVEFDNLYSGQPALLYDELFPTRDPQQLSKKITELMTMISDTQVNVNKADVADKNDIFDVTLIFGATNVPFIEDIPATCKQAVHRRFHKVGVRFKLNERLIAEGFKPHTVTEVITSSVKLGEKRVTSYEQYKEEERDDMYEFLFFDICLADDVAAGRECFERLPNGQPKWVPYNEAVDRMYALYAKQLTKNKVDAEHRFAQLTAMPGFETNYDEQLKEQMITEQIKMILQNPIEFEFMPPENEGTPPREVTQAVKTNTRPKRPAPFIMDFSIPPPPIIENITPQVEFMDDAMSFIEEPYFEDHHIELCQEGNDEPQPSTSKASEDQAPTVVFEKPPPSKLTPKKVFKLTPEQFHHLISNTIPTKTGRCVECMREGDEEKKYLWVYCGQYVVWEEIQPGGTYSYDDVQCKHGLCSTHAKSKSPRQVLDMFKTNKVCDCKKPLLYTPMSTLSVYQKIRRLLMCIRTQNDVTNFIFHQRMKQSGFYFMLNFVTMGLLNLNPRPTKGSIDTYLDFTLKTNIERGAMAISINKKHQPPRQHPLPIANKHQKACEHIMSWTKERLTYTCFSRLRNEWTACTEDEQGRSKEYVLPRYMCNDSCSMKPEHYDDLFEHFISINPMWAKDFERDPSVAERLPYECTPDNVQTEITKVNWLSSIKSVVLNNANKILAILATVMAGLGLLFGGYKLVKWLQKSRIQQQAYTTKGAKRAISKGPGQHVISRVLNQQGSFDIDDHVMKHSSSITSQCGIANNVFHLKDRIVIMPGHIEAWMKSKITAKETLYLTNMGKTYEFGTYEKFKTKIFSDLGQSLVMCRIPEIPQFSDITKHIMRAKDHMCVPYEIKFGIYRKGTFSTTECKLIGYDDQEVVATGIRVAEERHKGLYITTNSQGGLCSGVYYTYKTAQPKIFGLHVAGEVGTNARGRATPLYKETIDKACSEFVTALQQQGNFEDLDVIGYLDEGVYTPDKTKLKSSVISKQLEAAGIKRETMPSILTHKDPRFDADAVGAPTPLMAGVLTHGTNPAKLFEPKQLAFCTDAVARFYIENAPPFSPLKSSFTLEESIRGVAIDGHAVFKGLNLNTSVGFGGIYRTKGKTTKKDYITINEDEIIIDQQLMEEYEDQIKIRSTGERYGSIFMDQLKDERRPTTKKTTRVFSASEAVLSIISRAKLGPYIAAIHANHLALKTAIGMDPTSLEWDTMARDLLRHEHFLASDFKDFGPRIPRNVVEAVGISQEQWFDYYFPNAPIEDKLIRQSCHKEICPALHVAGKMIYEAPGGIPSGHSVTTPDNTKAHAIMDFYIYMDLAKEHAPEFATWEAFVENVVTYYLGDDEVKSISDVIFPWYNGVTISAAYAKYDIVFTDANKLGNVKENTWEELEFLKAKFVKHPFRDIWIPQMRLSTIYDCAHWIHKTDDELMMSWQNCEQSLALAWGRGPEFYDETRKLYTKLFRELGLDKPFRTWAELDYMIEHRTIRFDEGVFLPSRENTDAMAQYQSDWSVSPSADKHGNMSTLEDRFDCGEQCSEY